MYYTVSESRHLLGDFFPRTLYRGFPASARRNTYYIAVTRPSVNVHPAEPLKQISSPFDW